MLLSVFWMSAQAALSLASIVGICLRTLYTMSAPMATPSRMRRTVTMIAPSPRLMWCFSNQSTMGRNVPAKRTAKSAARNNTLVAASTKNTKTSTRTTRMMIPLHLPTSLAHGGDGEPARPVAAGRALRRRRAHAFIGRRLVRRHPHPPSAPATPPAHFEHGNPAVKQMRRRRLPSAGYSAARYSATMSAGARSWRSRSHMRRIGSST